MSSKIRQPTWHNPVPFAAQPPVLKVYNSLTKQKDVFVPTSGKQVTWYTCGPTVYAPSHLGHARAFLTSDIVRRILEDYFGYDVLFVMNITDIDDKIILATRYKLLFDEFKGTVSKLDKQLVEKCDAALESYIASKLGKFGDGIALSHWDLFVRDWAPGSSKAPSVEEEPKYPMFFKIAKSAKDALSAAQIGGDMDQARALVIACQDPLALALDAEIGHLVTDEKPFREFARFYEQDFFDDMKMLNIRRPDILTRVTEYVPEIVEFVAKIIQNGFAYEDDGSVYFDTAKFDAHPDHFYAKLSPWSAGDLKLLAEGEGDLARTGEGKKNKADFALWKGGRSGKGEPSWPSPWGLGRPGWHIECSVMASHVLGGSFDIHSGGIDLAFPHHDNELAQSEAFHGCKQWVNYFMHTGHLHIAGQKMSKSLKNFISIKEACRDHSPVHVRILFLLHPWESTLHFDESTLKESRDYEVRLSNFFVNVKAEMLQQSQNPAEFTGANDFGPQERSLLAQLSTRQASVHAALCDSFNTPKAMLDIRELVASSNSYMNDSLTSRRRVNSDVLCKICRWVMRMMKCFGVVNSDLAFTLSSDTPVQGEGMGREEIIAPYLKVLAEYRDSVRSLAQTKADHQEFLRVADRLRDYDLVELGVKLDDRADGKALVKFVDRGTLVAQRDEKVKKEEEKRLEREARKQDEDRKRILKLEKGRCRPCDLFKDTESSKLYSKWDDLGIPTHDAEGIEVSKSRRKKVEKEYNAQVKVHQEYQKE